MNYAHSKDDLKTIIEQHYSVVNGEHQIYLLPVKLVIEWRERGIISNWMKNRMPEPKRIEEIKAYQLRTGHINGTIQLAWLPREQLVCYDGNHRLQSLTEAVEYGV